MRKLLSLILCTVLLALCGCGESANSLSTISTPKANPKQTPADYVYNVMSDEEYNAISAIILSTTIDTTDPHIEDILFVKPEYLGYMRVAAQYFCDQVGLSGLPVLVDIMSRTHKDVRNSPIADFFPGGYYVIIRANAWSNDLRMGHNSAKVTYECKKTADKICKETLESTISSREKLDVLREWGLYALPYVLEEIENGNTEFESFFTEIGLHLSHTEYMEIAFLESFRPTMYEKLKAAGNPDDFDYKAWLSENEEDIENLFTYLDAYCAEYEAAQE